ncbi:DUF4249 family protein [candidate division KSB1 bacterium]|nr:DUF4249 family protein [candidate division KSB1 bacterium]
MVKKKRIFKILLLLLLLNCSSDITLNVQKTEGRLQVLSLISPAFKNAEVYVGMSYPECVPINVTGAQVVLKDSINTILLTEVQPGLYQDVNNSIAIRPGSTYFLNVTTANGKDFSAKTTVPDMPQIINFQNGDTLKIYSNWENYIYSSPYIKFDSSNTASYAILSTIININNNELYRHVSTDSSEVELPNPIWDFYTCRDTLFYEQARLQLWVGDSSAAYIEDPYQKIQSVKWNLFGSMTMTEIQVTIEYKAE